MPYLNFAHCMNINFLKQFLRNWDNAPPRYQNPPMAPPSSEYERPPPYYYR